MQLDEEQVMKLILINYNQYMNFTKNWGDNYILMPVFIFTYIIILFLVKEDFFNTIIDNPRHISFTKVNDNNYP